MKTTLKIVTIGNSKGVIIPSHILKRLQVEVDDLVEIDIKKVNGNKEK
jgi:antitoxin component of MazEF toxin-antitoxin module